MWPSTDPLYVYWTYGYPHQHSRPFARQDMAGRLLVAIMPDLASELEDDDHEDGEEKRRSTMAVAHRRLLEGSIVLFMRNRTALGRVRFVVQFATAADQDSGAAWDEIRQGLTDLLPSASFRNGVFAVDDDREKVFLNLLERL